MPPSAKAVQGAEMGEGSLEKVYCETKTEGCSMSVDTEGRVSGEVWESVVHISSSGQTRNSKEKQAIWSPEELKAATGRDDSSTVEHGFKLSSAYSEIQVSIMEFSYRWWHAFAIAECIISSQC